MRNVDAAMSAASNRPLLAALMIVLTLLAPGCFDTTPAADPAPSVDAPKIHLLEPPHPILPTNTLSREFDLATNPRDPDDIAAGIMTVAPDNGAAPAPGETAWLFWITLARSNDGGLTWQTHEVCGKRPAEDVAAQCPYAGAFAIGDPVLLFLADGTLLLSGLALNPHSAEVFVERYLPGQVIPASRTIVARGGLNQVQGAHQAPGGNAFTWHNDKQQLGVDQASGNVYLAWSWRDRLSSSSQTDYRSVSLLSRSNDDGRTWSAPTTFADEQPTNVDGTFRIGLWPAPTLDGTLHVFGWDVDRQAIFQVRSSDDGATFSPPRNIANARGSVAAGRGYLEFALPSVSIDVGGGPHHGTLYITYSDVPEKDRDVFVIRSDDHGATWSAPVRVNDDAPARGADQFLPEIVVEPSGAVSVLFMDRREDPDSQAYHAYLGRSTDGGNTFTNARITSAPSDASNGTVLGDYNAVTFGNETVLALWKDTTGGTREAPWYTGHLARLRPLE